jgi:Acetyltransferase (GNAT) family
MSVRPLAESDVPQVADLYWKVLRKRGGPHPPPVEIFLRELYFKNPWTDNSIPSLVYDEKGVIAGFLGVIPRKMCFRGEPVRVAFGGNFVVHPEFRNSLAGLHLLRTYMAGPQDLSQTDSANDTSRALLERLGFTTILPFSGHWIRLLKPTRSIAYGLSQFNQSAWLAAIEFAYKPICNLADRFISTVAGSPFRISESRLQAKDLDVETLLSCFTKFRGRCSLWPAYDAASLSWLLEFMERMRGYGENLRKRVLYDENGELVGWYIYYPSLGRVAEVAQIGGAKKWIKEVLDHLFWDAYDHGAIALRGTINPQLVSDFSARNCFFLFRGDWTLAWSREPTLLEVLKTGDAFLSRLDGDWCFALNC